MRHLKEISGDFSAVYFLTGCATQKTFQLAVQNLIARNAGERQLSCKKLAILPFSEKTRFLETINHKLAT